MPLSKIDSDSLNTPITAVDLAYTGTLTGGTGVVNLGSGQVYKDASGNVGYGTVSPSAKVQGNLDAAPSASGNMTGGLMGSAGDGAQAIAFGGSTGDYTWIQSAFRNNAAVSAASLRFYMGATERARIDSSGNLLVGTTSSSTPVSGFSAETSAGGSGVYTRINIGHSSSAGNGESFARFLFNITAIGSIVRSGASGVAYNTSSDYRLKNTIAPMTGALDKVALLKPVTYKWNVDGSDGQGFIAHELQEVVEGCVTGEKDAVDADGNPQYQGIDTSFLVATLTAAIQEQQAIITALTTRITALEAK